MDDIKKYTSDNLNWFVKTILIFLILLGCVHAFGNFFKSMSTLGVAYACFELIVAITAIIANYLLLSVNIIGFYIHVVTYVLMCILTICIDVDTGIGYIFSVVFALGFIFLILQIRKDGISAWKMMRSNQKLKKVDSLPETQKASDAETDNVYNLPELPCQLISSEPEYNASDLTSTNSGITLTPPPIEAVSEVLNGNSEDISTQETTTSEESPISGEPLVKKFSVFVELGIGICIMMQLLSILLDCSILGKISGDGYTQIFRLGISFINIILIILFIYLKHISVLSVSIALAIIQMFLIDFDALKLNIDVRDAGFNLIYFLCMYSPLLLTLFSEKDGITGWHLITDKYTSRTQKADKTESKINDSAIIEKVTSVDKLLSSVKTEETNVTTSQTQKPTVESSLKPAPTLVVGNADPVINSQLDRYTRLCHAISPANFVNPYSPKKVKLANELLEALIKNKDNEVVIALIEEKAKIELGVKLDNYE